MKELTIIKQGDAAYIDSREVAEIIGKNHKELLRDIRRYDEIIEKRGQRNFAPTSFFVESSFVDKWNRTQPCYLITRRGADIIANKLTGEKGVLFTAAYVTKFHEMSEREHASEIADIKAQAVTPRLKVFNTAVRHILSGYNFANGTDGEIMTFLEAAYKPFGIEVTPVSTMVRFTATEIAQYLCVFSENGLCHSHAVSAIIEKLNVSPRCISVSPYGSVGITIRYDGSVVSAVEDWIIDNNFPNDIPHNGFEYHVYYDYDRYERWGLIPSGSRHGDKRREAASDEYDLFDEYGDWFGNEE